MSETGAPRASVIQLHADRSPPFRPNADTLDRRLVKTATAFVLNSLPRRASLDEAAQQLDVDLPTLETAFQRCDLHPRRHIRAARLSALKRDLESGAVQRVDEALVRWGFPRHSQEAIQDYRRLFGETLEDTLVRIAPARDRTPEQGFSRTR